MPFPNLRRGRRVVSPWKLAKLSTRSWHFSKLAARRPDWPASGTFVPYRNAASKGKAIDFPALCSTPRKGALKEKCSELRQKPSPWPRGKNSRKKTHVPQKCLRPSPTYLRQATKNQRRRASSSASAPKPMVILGSSPSRAGPSPHVSLQRNALVEGSGK